MNELESAVLLLCAHDPALRKQVRPEWFPHHAAIVAEMQAGKQTLLRQWLAKQGCPVDAEARVSTLALQGLLTASEVREAKKALIGIGGEVRELMGQTLGNMSHEARTAFVEKVRALKDTTPDGQ